MKVSKVYSDNQLATLLQRVQSDIDDILHSICKSKIDNIIHTVEYEESIEAYLHLDYMCINRLKDFISLKIEREDNVN